MLINLFYALSLYLLALVALPKMIYQKLSGNKYQNSFAERFGIGFPIINKGNRKLVWIHAVSMGETKAVAALAKIVKKEYDNPIIVVTSITETGHAEAKRSMPFADHHLYLPFDFQWMISPILKQASPDLVILCETDFWYNFLRNAKKFGAKVALVNGKLSEPSMKRFQMLPKFAKTLFDQIDYFCVQNPLYAERFEKVGVSSDKITVTGNLKFDEEYIKLTPEKFSEMKDKFGITEHDKVLVIGSTHDPEETLILEELKKVWMQVPQLKVLIVPRHPDRFSVVADLLAQKNIPYVRYTELNKMKGDEKVILVDTMGLLRTCYQFADIAIVAGSYTSRVGGHNVIEPCGYGVPVIFGPYVHTQLELVNLVLEYRAGEQVSIENLSETLLKYLKDPVLGHKIGQGGKHLVSEMQGSTLKSWKAITS